MAQAPLAIRNIARSVLRYEAGGAQDADSLAAGVGRALAKMQVELSNLVGRRGVSALVGRSLNLAKRDFAVLEKVIPDAESPHVLIGLADSLQPQLPTDAEAACEAVLRHLLELLVNLLGHDLGLRPVERSWPGMAYSHRSESGSLQIEK